MKKYFYNILLLVVACIFGTACNSDLMELNKGEEELALSAVVPNEVLSEKLHAEDGVTLEWTTGSNRGTGNKISYTLEIAKAGAGYENAISYELGNQVYSKTWSVEDFNKFVVERLGCEYGDEVSLDARVIASVFNHDEYTQVAETTFNVISYKPVTSTLYMIGPATPNGWSADNPTELSREDNGIFSWVGKLKKGDFKFLLTKGEFIPAYCRDANDPSGTKLVLRDNDDMPDEKFEIPEDGAYAINVNLLDLTISIAPTTMEGDRFDQIYFVGSFTGWSFVPMTKDEQRTDLWHYGAVFEWNGGGEFKFATAQGWDNMLFASEDNAPYTSSKVVYNSSNDFKWFLPETQCGKAYKIDLIVSKGKEAMYMREFTPYKNIYLVGEATPNGWDLGNATPMVATDDYVFTWTGQLKAGEMKLSCDKQSDWMGAWFMPTKGNKTPTGETENMFFCDKSDDSQAALYPDLAYRDIDMKWKIAEAGTYTITLDQLKQTISIVKK